MPQLFQSISLASALMIGLFSISSNIKAETGIEEIQEFVSEFPSEYKRTLEGLPWIPDDGRLRESMRTFILKSKTDPDAEGLSIGSLTQALRFYEENLDGIQNKKYMRKAERIGSRNYYGPRSYNKRGISNRDYIVIVNYTLERYQRRFYILNLEKDQIVSTAVAHGYGSNDGDENQRIPSRFSNTLDSGMTSPGFYLTAELYCSRQDTFGRCRGGLNVNGLRLDGLSKTNWMARRRAVVYHGARYVTSDASYVKNSAGCPATSLSIFDRYHEKFQRGTLMYLYNASEWKKYKRSRTWQY